VKITLFTNIIQRTDYRVAANSRYQFITGLLHEFFLHCVAMKTYEAFRMFVFFGHDFW